MSKDELIRDPLNYTSSKSDLFSKEEPNILGPSSMNTKSTNGYADTVSCYIFSHALIFKNF